MIQSPFSTYCGFYCMLFIVSYKIGEKYWKSVLSKFNSNDLKMIKFVSLCYANVLKCFIEKIKN